MNHRLIMKCLTIALALALGSFALAEGMIQWPGDTPAPTPSATDSPALTLPPAETLKTEGPLLAAGPTPPATLAPIEAAGLEDDGLLRLELRSLDYPNQLHLKLSGVYAVEADPGFRFEPGTALTLSAVADRVYLWVGGLTIDMGQSLTLTRHQGPEGAENGIYIEESEKPTLYCGDLTVTAQGDTLRSLLTLPVEDYLYGVVGYEMSDSFPIEALKAQAVAARTYALQRKWQSGGRDYDVVDTTADQVFKGYDPELVNVILAVDDTRGVVGLYDGRFAICYYTASNGGQTALASQLWGGDGEDGYLTMRDDPYDLENPRSLQNELTVSALCEGSAELKRMLQAALSETMAAAGYGEGEWEFDSIAAIEPVNPRFEGSRMYDGLRFDLRVRVLAPVATPEPTATPEPDGTDGPTAAPTDPAATGTPQPEDTAMAREWVLPEETFAVTLDVYGQIKQGLSLGMNGSDCELIDVQAELDDAGRPRAFTLIMRRYGHGVGMSQRGAQWMAGHYDKTWREILAFYYPGMTLARMEWPGHALTRLEDLPAGVGAARSEPTPTPSPQPLRALREGEHYAVVTATMLNVRQRPTTASFAIGQLPKGRKVIVCSEPDADGWVSIVTGELDGFVKAEYLE